MVNPHARPNHSIEEGIGTRGGALPVGPAGLALIWVKAEGAWHR